MLERLHKFLAHCGIASRRKAEEIILEGRVTINGTVATELGIKIDLEKDRICVDGKPVQTEKKVYYLLHKPKDYTTTAEDELGRRTVLDLMGPDVTERVYPVGRLDRESEGLLVMTNDGALAYFLTHPSKGVRKVYEATVEGEVRDEIIEEVLEKGVRLGPVLVKPLGMKVQYRRKEKTVLHITVAEGINREVRRLFAALGHEVMRLVRLRVGPLALTGISRGTYRKLTLKELETVREWMERGGTEEAAKIADKLRGRRKNASRPTGKPDPANPIKIKRVPLLADLKEKRREAGRDSAPVMEDDRSASASEDGFHSSSSGTRTYRSQGPKRPSGSREETHGKRTGGRAGAKQDAYSGDRKPSRQGQERSSGFRQDAPDKRTGGRSFAKQDSYSGDRKPSRQGQERSSGFRQDAPDKRASSGRPGKPRRDGSGKPGAYAGRQEISMGTGRAAPSASRAKRDAREQARSAAGKGKPAQGPKAPKPAYTGKVKPAGKPKDKRPAPQTKHPLSR